MLGRLVPTYVLTIQLGNYCKTDRSQELSVTFSSTTLMFYFTMNDTSGQISLIA